MPGPATGAMILMCPRAFGTKSPCSPATDLHDHDHRRGQPFRGRDRVQPTQSDGLVPPRPDEQLDQVLSLVVTAPQAAGTHSGGGDLVEGGGDVYVKRPRRRPARAASPDARPAPRGWRFRPPRLSRPITTMFALRHQPARSDGGCTGRHEQRINGSRVSAQPGTPSNERPST